MRRFLSFVLASSLVLPLAGARALEQASVPPKFGTSWASSAGAAYVRSIPATSQIGIQNCAASLPDGFPPLTFTPASAGGCPPYGQDFNGVLKQLSQWNQWQAAGGPVFFDAAFATAIGGYPKGAMIQSAVTPGTLWLSTADDNSANPDNFGAGWVQAPGQVPIGTPLQSLTTAVPAGYVSANGTTVGNASSNATNRANADTKFLFSFLWTACPACQLFNSSGTPIARGGSAAADYAANDALATPSMNGLGLMGADSQSGTTSTFLSGVPVTSGSRTVPGSVLGENLHALTSGENGTHTHANSLTDPGHVHGGIPSANTQANSPPGGFGWTVKGDNTLSAFTGITLTNAASGSGTAHNTVERSMVAYWNLKL